MTEELQSMSELNRIVVIGHPFSTLGMGGQARSCVAALQSVGARPQVMDVYGHAARVDPILRNWLEPIETTDVNNAVRIFHVNGDELPRVIETLEVHNGFRWDAGPNVVCPAWELPLYPAAWAKEVSRFDLCWGISKFVTDAIAKSVTIPVDWVGQCVDEASLASLPRRFFGIRESSFVFLAFFDYSSYVQRKNPKGVYEAFARAFPVTGLADVQLVIKTAGKPAADDPLPELLEADHRVKVISGHLSSLEMDSLISSCDCFVSLHRAEGFGRGPAEALLRGKAVIATAYSGTEDYLTDENSARITYTLIPVNDGEYPFWQGQTWAEPDIAVAAEHMRRNFAGRWRAQQRRIGALDVLAACGNRSVGLRMLTSVQRLLAPT